MPIELYSPAWQEGVTELGARVFGPGYFGRASEIARDPESSMLVSVSKDDELEGFIYGRVLAAGELVPFLGAAVPDTPPEIEEADNEGVLGMIRTVCVAPEFQGKGIGTRLLRAIHDRLVGHGADKLIVTFKRGPAAVNVDPLMEKLGFKLWTRSASYYKGRCDSGEFHCIDRTDKCICEALFYHKLVF